MRRIESEFTCCERVDGRRRRQCTKRATRQLVSGQDSKPWAACNGHSRKAQRGGAKAVTIYVKPVYY